MKRTLICMYSLLFLLTVRAQENEIVHDPNYLEDQLYFALTYNILTNKPASIAQNGFSGGYSLGFIKDIPLREIGNPI